MGISNYKEICGKYYAVSSEIICIQNIGTFLDPINGKLMRTGEFAAMRANGFPWVELGITGEIWSATRISCSGILVWRIRPDNNIEMVHDAWSKAFLAWGLAIPK